MQLAERLNLIAPSRRRFFQAAAASALVLAPAAQSADTGANILGPTPGYSPQIGTLVSQMTWMRGAVLSTVKGLTPDQLDFLLDPKANRIGALIHHLAIANNVPLGRIARFLQRLGRHLVVEFVPKEDSQVRRLLATREDIFPEYHLDGFEQAFAPYFRVIERLPLRESVRTLYLVERR